MSQNSELLSYLKKRRSIQPMTALYKLGIYRLAARINDLRDAGYWIETVIEDDGEKRWAKYIYKGDKRNG